MRDTISYFKHMERVVHVAGAPSSRGIKEFPPDGYYVVDEDWKIPCTCKDDCPYNCKGECGCEAHHAAWMDFLSMDF
jgi:hypothetical protein